MKYKVGDKVRIKSLDWYNENKDDYGYVWCTEFLFTPEHSKYCGRELTISHITEFEIPSYVMESNGHDWTAEMIEGLVERNGKTYPYKIGDRVVLKGNHRCATITDLKYNSSGNLSYYIKIDNDKDISTDCPTDLLLPYDNVVEGLVEEETKPGPKFKVGDKIKLKSTLLNDIFGVIGYEPEGYRITNISNGLTYFMSYSIEHYYKLVEEEAKPKYEDEVTGEYYSTPKYLVRPSGYQFVDENGNVINATKIILEKKQYPKTYEECAEIVEDCADCSLKCFACGLLNNLQMLLLCRDAYWKIAGAEMGLGEPWEPDWDDENQEKYIIGSWLGTIQGLEENFVSHPFAFPTSEMRYTFYENFKEKIEQCKELL